MVRSRLGIAALALLVLLGAGTAWLHHWRTRGIGPVQRGARVAEANGCFTCHGPGGLRGIPNPGHGLGEAPAFPGGLVTMYVENEAEIREWILDGLPARIKKDAEQMKHRANAAVTMPPYRGIIEGRDLDDLVAFFKAASDFEKPKDEKAEEGREVALRTGCFNCHGPQGRGSPPNPGSLKGYIPSWDGGDYPELVVDEAELREWILDGAPKRLLDNQAARFFMERAPVKMPAYRQHLKPAEVDRLVDYIRWLRTPRSS